MRKLGLRKLDGLHLRELVVGNAGRSRPEDHASGAFPAPSMYHVLESKVYLLASVWSLDDDMRNSLLKSVTNRTIGANLQPN